MEGLFFIKTEDEMISTYGPNFRRNYGFGWDHNGMNPLLGMDVTEAVLDQLEQDGEYIEDFEDNASDDAFYFGDYTFKRASIKMVKEALPQKVYTVTQNGLFT